MKGKLCVKNNFPHWQSGIFHAVQAPLAPQDIASAIIRGQSDTPS